MVIQIGGAEWVDSFGEGKVIRREAWQPRSFDRHELLILHIGDINRAGFSCVGLRHSSAMSKLKVSKLEVLLDSISTSMQCVPCFPQGMHPASAMVSLDAASTYLTCMQLQADRP